MDVVMCIKSINDQGGYLTVSIKGKYIVDELIRCVDEIGETAARTGQTKVLVDLSELQVPPTTQHELTVAKYVAAEWRGKLRAAFFGHSKSELRFREDVARNRGANVAGFSSSEEAAAWLFD